MESQVIAIGSASRIILHKFVSYIQAVPGGNEYNILRTCSGGQNNINKSICLSPILNKNNRCK